MAVEASHLNLFSPQLISNREMKNPMDANINLYNNTQMGYSSMGYSSILPLSGTTAATTTETLLRPTYNTFIAADRLPQKTAMNSDNSSLTCNFPSTRKRPRDNINSISYNLPSYPTTTTTTQQQRSGGGSFSFLGEDISLQIQQQQLDIDHLIAQRMEKVRMELEEKRKRQARRIMEAIEVGVMKRLKTKEDEIEKIGKLNWALEERVKSLCMENQILRDLAQANEATANALRNELEQVLTRRSGRAAAMDDDGATVCPTLMDDAISCCGSTDGCDDDYKEENNNNNNDNAEGWRTIVGCAWVKDKDGGGHSSGGIIGNSSNCRSSRLCRNCGKEESCVLILPCRHLCLCTICGSTLHTCPICKSFKTASVHINMS